MPPDGIDGVLQHFIRLHAAADRSPYLLKELEIGRGGS
jgi:hypothetical protein